MDIRPATFHEALAVRSVLDGALLELEDRTVEDAIERDDVLVAVRKSNDSDTLVLGTVVMDGPEILAIAVRNRRRGQGIGTALVEAAAEHHDVLHAEFHERVRPFWESLGFGIEPVAEDDRFRGSLST